MKNTFCKALFAVVLGIAAACATAAVPAPRDIPFKGEMTLRVKTVAWEGPAFGAGVGIGAKLTTVGGQPYTDDALKQAIKAAAATKQPIALGFEADGQPQTVLIPYYGSLRYPRLERLPGKPDRLARLLAPNRSTLLHANADQP